MAVYLSSVRHAVQHPALTFGAALGLWGLIVSGVFDRGMLSLPWSLPIMAAMLMWLAWVFTVCREMNSWLLISWFEQPWAISCSTANSRVLRVSC